MRDRGDLDRTIEELTEILACGNAVEAHLDDVLTVCISLTIVSVSVHTYLEDPALIDDLASSTPSNLHVPLPSLGEAIGSPQPEPEEVDLMLRALKARALLLGT